MVLIGALKAYQVLAARVHDDGVRRRGAEREILIADSAFFSLAQQVLN